MSEETLSTAAEIPQHDPAEQLSAEVRHRASGLSAVFNKVSVGQRIIALAGILMLILLVVGGIGIIKMRAIGAEIEAIAEQDVPLTKVITTIESGQLEQSVEFERAVRFGELVTLGQRHLFESFENAKGAFEDKSRDVTAQIVAGEEIAQNAIDHAGSAAQREEFEEVLRGLQSIEATHASFERRSWSSASRCDANADASSRS